MMQNIKDYQPRAYHIPPDGEDIDVDGSNDGDYIVCPVHPDEIIYVMGTRWWQLEEGPTIGFKGGWCQLTIKGYCKRCGEHHSIPVGSYGG